MPLTYTIDPLGENTDEAIDNNQNNYLRSVKEVEGYSIDANDGDIGHIEEIIVNDQTWMIRYLVIATRNWLPGGKKVLVAPEWIKRISWNKEHISVELTKEKIKNAPEYLETKPITRKYEARLYEYYGLKKYW